MRKSLLLVLYLITSAFSLSAQSRFSYSVELSVGAGVWKGSYFTIAPEFVAQYDFSFKGEYADSLGKIHSVNVTDGVFDIKHQWPTDQEL